jgi:hypothetical protein
VGGVVELIRAGYAAADFALQDNLGNEEELHGSNEQCSSS